MSDRVGIFRCKLALFKRLMAARRADDGAPSNPKGGIMMLRDRLPVIFTTTALLCIAVAGCAPPYSPPSLLPVERPATGVDASFGRTWDAVIDGFAARNIPIQTLERASGFIAAEPLQVSDADTTMADCGRYEGATLLAGRAYYNVRVLGDSTRSSVRVTVRWTNLGPSGAGLTQLPCVSTGSWESAFEGAIKERAERAAAAGRL